MSSPARPASGHRHQIRHLKSAGPTAGISIALVAVTAVSATSINPADTIDHCRPASA